MTPNDHRRPKGVETTTESPANDQPDGRCLCGGPVAAVVTTGPGEHVAQPCGHRISHARLDAALAPDEPTATSTEVPADD